MSCMNLFQLLFFDVRSLTNLFTDAWMQFFPSRIAEQIRKSKSKDKVTLVSPNCKMWHVNLHIENNGVFMGGETGKILYETMS